MHLPLSQGERLDTPSDGPPRATLCALHHLHPLLRPDALPDGAPQDAALHDGRHRLRPQFADSLRPDQHLAQGEHARRRLGCVHWFADGLLAFAAFRPHAVALRADPPQWFGLFGPPDSAPAHDSRCVGRYGHRCDLRIPQHHPHLISFGSLHSPIRNKRITIESHD